MEKIIISLITLAIIVIFFWLLASIRQILGRILDEFRKVNNPALHPPFHLNCRSKTIPVHENETEITTEMVDRLKGPYIS